MTNLLPYWLRPAAGVYLFGGCVRGLLLGRTPIDYSIVFLGVAPAYAPGIAASVSGRDLILELGLNSSRRFKEILDLVNEKRLSQESFSRAEASDLIHACLGNHP